MGFDAVAWFGRFGAEGRVELVRAVAMALRHQDPTWEACLGMWRAGKSVRIEADVPDGLGGVSPVGLHLAVEAGDRQLLGTLLRKLDGPLEFHKGGAELNGVGAVAAWVASLGTGSLTVMTFRGEVFIKADRRQPVAAPLAVLEGAPMPLPPAEGLILHLHEGQLHLIASYEGLSQQEIDGAEQSEVEIGVVRASRGLLLVAVNVPGLTSGWADMPFSLAVEPPANRRVQGPNTDGTSALVLLVIERADASVRVLRPLRLSATFTSALQGLLEEQQDNAGSYGMAAYQRDVEAAYARWQNSHDLVPDMLARDTIPARG